VDNERALADLVGTHLTGDGFEVSLPEVADGDDSGAGDGHHRQALVVQGLHEGHDAGRVGIQRDPDQHGDQHGDQHSRAHRPEQVCHPATPTNRAVAV
jgi:hypothetical protein